MRPHLLAATLAALTLFPALDAQQAIGGTDTGRKTSIVMVSTDVHETVAAVAIGYTPARWRDDYQAMLEPLKSANYTRLGKNWWTTFDTIGTVEIGGTKIEAGSYYLGLAVDKDGAFSLLVFDSKQVMKAGLLPGTTALYTGEAKPEISAPLTFAKDSLKEVAVDLVIEITGDKKDPTTGKLSLRWGKHELSAPVKFHLAEVKDGTNPKK